MIRLCLVALVCAGCADVAELVPDSGRPDASWPDDERDRGSTEDAGVDGLAIDGAAIDGAADARPGSPDAEPDSAPPPDAAPPLDCGGFTQCGAMCVDLEDDALNCGQCGRTCVLPNAEPACAGGACVVGACAPGFFDGDGDPENGCELESMCVEGAACQTACGTDGSEMCVDGIATCRPPPDGCNAIDDDCDGACDEDRGMGCRTGIHRASGNGHLYTNDRRQAEAAPFRLESADYFHVYGTAHQGMRALFLCSKPNGKFFLSSDTACEIQRAPVRQLGYWSPTPLCGSTPLYRLYNPDQGNHFFTINPDERARALAELGYLDEGTPGHVWPAP